MSGSVTFRRCQLPDEKTYFTPSSSRQRISAGTLTELTGIGPATAQAN